MSDARDPDARQPNGGAPGSYRGEVGLQFTTHIANQYRVRDLVDLAALAHAEGFHQVWVNDNLRFRHVFVVLAMMAERVPMKLGTAVLVPYFRNPVDTVDALVTISELMDGRELSVGMARGSTAQAGKQLQTFKPIAFLAETAQMTARLLQGERVVFADFPTLKEYYRLGDAALQMAVQPSTPIKLYCGGNAPKSLAVGGRHMDGLVWSGTFIALLRAGKLEPLLEIADRAARESQPGKRLRKVAEVNLAIDRDPERARAFISGYVAHGMITLKAMRLSDDDFRRLGVEPADVQALSDMFDRGATIEQAAREGVTRAMVDALSVNGSPEACVEPLLELCAQAERLGFDQISFSKIGPDYDYAIRALGKQVLPRLLG